MTRSIEKYTLITNIRSVSLGGMRAYCHAILLMDSDGIHPDERLLKIRGFGTEPAWEVFDIFVNSLAYTLEPAQSPHTFVSDDGEVRPLSSGYLMKFKDGPELVVVVADQERELVLDQFEGSDSPVMRVWEVLPLRVRQFWRAPNFPTLTWRRL